MSCWQPKPDSGASPGACLIFFMAMRTVPPTKHVAGVLCTSHWQMQQGRGCTQMLSEQAPEVKSAIICPHGGGLSLCQLSITCVAGALCSGAQADCSACRGAGDAGAGLPEHCRRPAAPARAGLCTSLHGGPICHRPSFLMLCTESPPCASDLDHLSSSVSS